MIPDIEAEEMPGWLKGLDRRSILEGALPLQKILANSLYYPASDVDGEPVRYLGGNVHSFVYADYAVSWREALDVLRTRGFTGYGILAFRRVGIEELAPRPWLHFDPKEGDGNPDDWRHIQKPFSALWAVMQREPEQDGSHGPRRFSLLHVCADGVEVSDNLYCRNSSAPKVLAIIQQTGMNWTDFRDRDAVLARLVLGSRFATPQYLLCGGCDRREPCWPEYSEFVCYLDGGNLGLWRRGSG